VPAIERQLAHAEHLPERRRMMQAWADRLQKLHAGADVVAFPELRHRRRGELRTRAARRCLGAGLPRQGPALSALEAAGAAVVAPHA